MEILLRESIISTKCLIHVKETLRVYVELNLRIANHGNTVKKLVLTVYQNTSIGNAIVSRGIWDKYFEQYFKIVPKHHESLVLFVYTTRLRNFAFSNART